MSIRDFREAHHLPKNRPDQAPPDPEELPRQRRGTTPQMHGRYPDYDVLAHADHWDEVTRRLVLDRAENEPPIRFFTEPEAETLMMFCDVVTDQYGEPRIPVLAYVDEKLYEGRLDGYQYADLPDDRETWRLVARGLDEQAQARGAESYARAGGELQQEICGAFAAGELSGGVWDELNVGHAWSVVMRMVLSAFYAHPWAWNEIGFGGPAYPEGYMRLGIGLDEPHEEPEAFTVDPVRDVRERGLG